MIAVLLMLTGLVFYSVSARAETAALMNAHANPYPAAEFVGIEAWLNSEPRTMASLKGKVVLVDFWTYSCINCIRTLPYVNDWHAKYRDKGLVIVGVHSPEFSFEKSRANVEKALVKYGISYPVALDNNMETWNNFKNRYWPAHYLINQQGQVVYKHFGEGEYDVMEHNIRALLGLDAAAVTTEEAPSFMQGQTPETYLGYSRAKNFVSKETPQHDVVAQYDLADDFALHQWGLKGKWNIQPSMVSSEADGASLVMYFKAAKVYLVLGTRDGKPVKATVTLNGKPLGDAAARDAAGGVIAVDQHALYAIVSQPELKPGLLEITADREGLEAYAFTFGN